MPQSGSSVLDRQMGATAVSEGRVFHTLDALRGSAAIGVVVYHMSLAFTPIAAPGGYLAVDLFFMMSGVVLSHAYEGRFKAGMGALDFMRARLIRLYPLYLLGTVFGILVALASLLGRNSQTWDASSLLQSASRALFFVPNVSTTPVNEMFPLNIPSWSLFFEFLVNLLFVLFWPLLTSRRLVALSLLMAGAVMLAIVLKGSIDQGSIASSFTVGLARTVFGFCVGVLIARRILRVHRHKSNLRVIGIVGVVVIALTGRPEGELRAIWDAVCVLVVFPLIVYWATIIDPGERLRKVATFLGVTSYAVYVLHTPVSSVLNSAARYFAGITGVSVGGPYLGVAVLAILLTGCWLIDKYFDMPVRRHLSRIVPRVQALREES